MLMNHPTKLQSNSRFFSTKLIDLGIAGIVSTCKLPKVPEITLFNKETYSKKPVTRIGDGGNTKLDYVLDIMARNEHASTRFSRDQKVQEYSLTSNKDRVFLQLCLLA